MNIPSTVDRQHYGAPTSRWGRAKKKPKFRELAHGRLQCIDNTGTVIEPVGYGKYRSVAREEKAAE